MKIYILFKNDDDDLSSLPKDAELVYLFAHIKGAPDLDHIRDNLTEVLDKSQIGDRIVFNGPSYLAAIAGYVWFTNSNRTKMDMYAYSLKHKAYIEHTNDIGV